MLIATCIIDLNMHAIDFINTFSQAEQKGPPVYMAYPPGIEMYSYEVMMLKKSLHRQDEAPILWFEKLKFGLEDQNFEPIDYDPCMFVHDKVVCLVYLLLMLLYWPLVCEVCPNYELVMFQPWTGISLDLGSVDNCYVAVNLIPSPTFLPTTQCPTRGGGDLLVPLIYISI